VLSLAFLDFTMIGKLRIGKLIGRRHYARSGNFTQSSCIVRRELQEPRGGALRSFGQLK
jgi:hypothetical protein